MTLTTDLKPVTLVLLFTSVLVSTYLSGSSLQWALDKGLLEKKLLDKANQYNVFVAIAGTSSMIQTLLCFINNLMAPNLILALNVVIVANWMVMVNSSIMLVSQRLSLTFQSPNLAWKRLLWINYILFPFCLLVAVTWSFSWGLEDTPVLDRIVQILEPVQIATLGIIEFLLSGAFIVQMWKYKWTTVERRGMFMLLLVGCCDLTSVLLNVFMGDLESTCVKGLVYSIRIRLEVNVLCCMVDYLKHQRCTISYGNNRPSQRRTASAFFTRSMLKLKEDMNNSEVANLRNSRISTAPINSIELRTASADFNVSQLRSITESCGAVAVVEEPHADLVSSEEMRLMEEGEEEEEYFSNPYIREHVLTSRRGGFTEAEEGVLEDSPSTPAVINLHRTVQQEMEEQPSISTSTTDDSSSHVGAQQGTSIEYAA